MRNHLIQNTESQKNLTLVLLKFGYDTDLGLVHIHNNALTKNSPTMSSDNYVKHPV